MRDIGIQEPDEVDWDVRLMESADYHRPARDPFSHKGSFGTLGVIGGFLGMEGAGNLCATAALRFGVGKVRVLTDGNLGRFHHDSVMVDLQIGLANGQIGAWRLYPNPSRGALYLELPEWPLGPVQVMLWDAQGKRCGSMDLVNDGRDRFHLPLPEGLSNGTYLLQVRQAGKLLQATFLLRRD